MYCLRPEQQPIFIFCVDVSPRALETGFTAACLAAVEASLDAVPGGERARVGVMTFDKCLQVYRFDEEGNVSQMVVAADTEVGRVQESAAGWYTYGRLRDMRAAMYLVVRGWFGSTLMVIGFYGQRHCCCRYSGVVMLCYNQRYIVYAGVGVVGSGVLTEKHQPAEVQR